MDYGMAADGNAATAVSKPFMGQDGHEEGQDSNSGEGWHIVACLGSLVTGHWGHPSQVEG
jgi:hypothetical protein